MSTGFIAPDDPLAGILSDGSDDSFFEDPRQRRRKASLAKATPEKKAVNDLFNISGTEDKSLQNIEADTTSKFSETAIRMDDEDDWLGIKSSSAAKSKDSGIESEKLPLPVAQPAKTLPKKTISFDDDDDILSTLGLGKKSTTEKLESKAPPETSKKTNLLDSILGTPKEEQKKITSFEDILRDSKAAAGSDTIKAQSATVLAKKEPAMQSSISFAASDIPREGRRGRKNSAGLLDPLGLFANDPKTSESVSQTKPQTPGDGAKKLETLYVTDKSSHSMKKQTQDHGLPDWLNGSAVRAQQSELQQPTKQEPKAITQAQHTPTQVEPQRKTVSDNNPQMTIEDQSQIPQIPLLTQQQLAHSNIEFQNTAMALQQQESQVLMALQLKKYEDNLTSMQKQQQEVLMKQEQQFNILLERQFAKQQAMENGMRLQQERINNHIQLLLSQPPLPKTIQQEAVEEIQKTAKDENVKLYENMLNSLRQRQHEEVFLLEESYKKQITLLEQTMEAVENRLKTEVSKLSEGYEDRIRQLKDEHEDEVKKSSERLKELEQYHLNEIKQIRENHSRIIEEIKYEHSTIVDTIKNLKQSENELLGNASSYGEKLDTSLQVLHSSNRVLQELQDKVHKDYGVLSLAREEALKAKEQEIAAMRTTLDKCRETAESERAQLMGLVRTLEIKLSEQTQASKEESWAFQQASATLAARSAALDREAEFNRHSIEREREQLKTLKESMLAEQEKMILQLTEEKLALAAERSRLETSNKLALNFDSQKSKAELDAALQVAKEAADLTERERERLHQELCEVEMLKHGLREKERHLSRKETDMQMIIQNAERRMHEGERKMRESKSTECRYNEKFKELQNQLASLSRREKKLSEEKISLSKERLALHTMIKQNRRCGLCQVDQPNLDDSSYHELSQDDRRSHEGPRYITTVADPELVRLRMEATEDDHIGNTCTRENISI